MIFESRNPLKIIENHQNNFKSQFKRYHKFLKYLYQQEELGVFISIFLSSLYSFYLSGIPSFFTTRYIDNAFAMCL